MIDYGKLYDEFLYDCYIANQRLTAEDWHYYGREEHHIEIPRRDEGVLTPLNSQPLTIYQHWIAGVLQSEVLGKCCFAMVPVGKLPSCLEDLRVKWHTAICAEAGRIGGKTGDLSNRNRKVALSRWANATQQEREDHGEAVRNSMTREEKSAAAKKRWANTTPEQRSENARKAWETKRRNQQGG